MCAVVSRKSFRNLRLHASRDCELVADPHCGRVACTGDISCSVAPAARAAPSRQHPTFMPHLSVRRQLKYDGFDAERDYGWRRGQQFMIDGALWVVTVALEQSLYTHEFLPAQTSSDRQRRVSASRLEQRQTLSFPHNTIQLYTNNISYSSSNSNSSNS